MLLEKLIKNKDTEGIKKYIEEHDLKIENGKVVPKDKEKTLQKSNYYDMMQLINKTALNSIYGSLLNNGSKFYDYRMGQSVTLTGRRITRHMSSKTNEIITGTYTSENKAIIYGDTDSTYFSAYEYMRDPGNDDVSHLKDFDWNNDSVVNLYDSIAEEVNKSFSKFMREEFNVTEQNSSIIGAAREKIGYSGYFPTKKRYAILVYDDEGIRLDKDGKLGELDIKGIEIKRKELPIIVREFLKELMYNVLSYKDEVEIQKIVKEFRRKYMDVEPWTKGILRTVKEISKFEYMLKNNKKVTVPGHVRASMNWNLMLSVEKDRYSKPITDGTKVIVCKLKHNHLGHKSIAYPIDQAERLPSWFKEMPFDDEAMEVSGLRDKIKSIFDSLDIDFGINEDIRVAETANKFFTFD